MVGNIVSRGKNGTTIYQRSGLQRTYQDNFSIIKIYLIFIQDCLHFKSRRFTFVHTKSNKPNGMEKYIDLEINCTQMQITPGSGDCTIYAKNVLPEQVMKSLSIEQVINFFGKDAVVEALELEAA